MFPIAIVQILARVATEEDGIAVDVVVEEVTALELGTREEVNGWEEDGIAVDVVVEEVTALELGIREEVNGWEEITLEETTSTEQLANKVMNTIGMNIFIWINTFLP